MALSIKKLALSEYGIKMKATVQATGKLSFTDATAQNMHLQKDDRFAIYQDTTKKDLFYMVGNNNDPDAFPVKKSGMYHYMATTTLFQMLGFDFKNVTYIFDILRVAQYDEELGGTAYKLMCRKFDKNIDQDIAPAIPEDKE